MKECAPVAKHIYEFNAITSQLNSVKIEFDFDTWFDSMNSMWSMSPTPQGKQNKVPP